MVKTPSQLILRVTIDVAETDYGAGLSHSSTKFRLSEEDGLTIPTHDVGESARTMLENAFNLPAVSNAYQALVKESDDKDSGDDAK